MKDFYVSLDFDKYKGVFFKHRGTLSFNQIDRESNKTGNISEIYGVNTHKSTAGAYKLQQTLYI